MELQTDVLNTKMHKVVTFSGCRIAEALNIHVSSDCVQILKFSIRFLVRLCSDFYFYEEDECIAQVFGSANNTLTGSFSSTSLA